MPSLHRPLKAVLAGAALLCALAPSAQARFSSTPLPTPVFNGPVSAAVSSGDKAFVAGDFTQVGPNTGRVGVFDANSGERLPLSGRIGGGVNASTADGHGGFFVAGVTSAAGRTYDFNGYRSGRLSIAHVLASGKIDSRFIVRRKGEIQAMVATADKLWLAGHFNTFKRGDPRSDVILVSARTGAIDPRFRSAKITRGDNITSIALGADRVYVGGTFGATTGYPTPYLVALDRSTGKPVSAFQPSITGFPGGVQALALSGGRLYVAGVRFVQPPGGEVLALDAGTGVRMPGFASPSGILQPSSLAVLGGTLYVAGISAVTPVQGFYSFDQSVVAADAVTGARQTGFASPALANPALGSYRPSLQLAASAGRLFLGGAFIAVNGSRRPNAAALDAGTGALDPLDPRPDNVVLTVSAAGTRVFLGGNFDSVNGAYRDGLAAVSLRTGGLDPGFAPSFSGGSAGIVSFPHGAPRALALSGGKLAVGGSFTSVGGQARANLAFFDPASGALDPAHPDPDDVVSSLSSNGSRLFVNGAFNRIGALDRPQMAALDATSGAVDPGFDAQLGPGPQYGRPFRTLPYGSRVFVADGSTMRSLDARTGAAVLGFAPFEAHSVFALAAIGTRLYVGGYPSRQRLFAADARSGRAIRGFGPPVNGGGSLGTVYAMATHRGRLFEAGVSRRGGSGTTLSEIYARSGRVRYSIPGATTAFSSGALLVTPTRLLLGGYARSRGREAIGLAIFPGTP